MPLLLTEDDVRAVLTMEEALHALEMAFRLQATGAARNTPRMRVSAPNGAGTLHTLSAFVPGQPGRPELDGPGLIGHKAYTTFAGAARPLVTLYSGADGAPLALIEAGWLGQMRTGAASGVATRYMARPDAQVLGLLGAGNQARAQLLAMVAVRPIQTALVYSRDEARREAFCAEMAERTGIELRPTNAAENAVRVADIVVTATTAREPVARGAWLRAGAHVNAVGSNAPNRREVDSEALGRSAVVAVDDIAQARVEAGDLLIPAAAGRFDMKRAVELGGIVAGMTLGRKTPEDVTFFESLGIGLEDVAVAGVVLTRARERGLGREIELLASE